MVNVAVFLSETPIYTIYSGFSTKGPLGIPPIFVGTRFVNTITPTENWFSDNISTSRNNKPKTQKKQDPKQKIGKHVLH